MRAVTQFSSRNRYLISKHTNFYIFLQLPGKTKQREEYCYFRAEILGWEESQKYSHSHEMLLSVFWANQSSCTNCTVQRVTFMGVITLHEVQMYLFACIHPDCIWDLLHALQEGLLYIKCIFKHL